MCVCVMCTYTCVCVCVCDDTIDNNKYDLDDFGDKDGVDVNGQYDDDSNEIDDDRYMYYFDMKRNK